MTQADYEQKKRECWEEFCKEHPLDATANGGVAFRYAFDRAYQLGGQVKDAEREEMLTVSAITVREMYTANERIKTDAPDKELGRISDHINHVLRCLFGSKCPPDLSEVKRTLSENLSEQKPEPQFSVGNWVRVISTDKLGCTGEIIEVEIDEDGIRYQISPEQTPSDSSDNSDSSDPRPSRNISQHITNCDKQLDNTLKDSFRKERRLNIAATTMGHIIQCKYYSLSEEYRARNINEITKLSFQLADALMAKAELST